MVQWTKTKNKNRQHHSWIQDLSTVACRPNTCILLQILSQIGFCLLIANIRCRHLCPDHHRVRTVFPHPSRLDLCTEHWEAGCTERITEIMQAVCSLACLDRMFGSEGFQGDDRKLRRSSMPKQCRKWQTVRAEQRGKTKRWKGFTVISLQLKYTTRVGDRPEKFQPGISVKWKTI